VLVILLAAVQFAMETASQSKHVTGTDRSSQRAASRAGLFFVGVGATFLTGIMFAATMVDGYAFGTSAISDLGTYPESALLFNGLLITVGLANILGGYYLYRLHGRRWLLGVYTLAGVGAIGAGVFTLDSSGLHGVFALVAFLSLNLQAVGTAGDLSGIHRVLAAGAGLLGLAFVVIMIVGDAGTTAVFGPIGHGGAERMIVFPVMFWLMALGGALLGPSGPMVLRH
jgi:hypothetical membrane protein